MGEFYKCNCGNNTFYLVEKKVTYRNEIRMEAVLACGSCLKDYRIQPCSTGGLTK